MTCLLKRETPIGAVNSSAFFEVPATINRLGTPYQLLKNGPALSLAGEFYEDQRFVQQRSLATTGNVSDNETF